MIRVKQMQVLPRCTKIGSQHLLDWQYQAHHPHNSGPEVEQQVEARTREAEGKEMETGMEMGHHIS